MFLLFACWHLYDSGKAMQLARLHYLIYDNSGHYITECSTKDNYHLLEAKGHEEPEPCS